jgi:hypothetical protein
VYGVDFTCAPRRAKAITVAAGVLKSNALRVDEVENLQSFAEFEAFLARPGPWIGGFDFPFSLPLELVRDLGWPKPWPQLVAHCAAMTRLELRAALDAYRNTRQPGSKYAHRATDFPAGSSSPMKLVNPPVALMFREGAPRLADAGVHIPSLADGDRSRVALEAYPGFFARSVTKLSYKNDAVSKQTPERRAARKKIVAALPVTMSSRLKHQLIDDASGDALDAVICAAQAAWGWRRRRRNYGLPDRIESCEGWIVSA